MKKLLILSLTLAVVAGCAGSDYGHTASSPAFKMVHPKPTNNGREGGYHASN